MAQPPAKYQPYRGYGCAHPWYWYVCSPNVPTRVRTRSDWRLNIPAWDYLYDEANAQHYRPFSRRSRSVFEKRRVHRAFRQRVKAALRAELCGDDAVSHNFRFYGDWLD